MGNGITHRVVILSVVCHVRKLAIYLQNTTILIEVVKKNAKLSNRCLLLNWCLFFDRFVENCEGRLSVSHQQSFPACPISHVPLPFCKQKPQQGVSFKHPFFMKSLKNGIKRSAGHLVHLRFMSLHIWLSPYRASYKQTSLPVAREACGVYSTTLLAKVLK